MEKSFIEMQFPVGRISKECFKERKAGSGQTLTGIGKWWGRKPLFLIRSALLGSLMPCSDDPKKDLDIFMKILTMDEEGLLQRKKERIPSKKLKEILGTKYKNYETTNKAEQIEIERGLFSKFNYDEKIAFCLRPEQIDGPSEKSWGEINDHLGTNAKNLNELVEELGQKKWGRTPRVGDVFCGGGSVPFEAARLGADTFASDLNPVATLLTWGSVKLLNSPADEQVKIQKTLQKVFEKVGKKIEELGIEKSKKGDRADAFLYCAEAICPSTGYLLPLAPSWIISESDRVCAVLKKDTRKKRYKIEIVKEPDNKTWSEAQKGTLNGDYVICPETGEKFSIKELRGDNKINGKSKHGLRTWENEDISPKPEDIFQERLYCIRWKNETGTRYYSAPTSIDLLHEEQIKTLVQKELKKWQKKGLIPSTTFDPEGYNTCQPVRERGWTHWHHLFTPRQLLYKALLMEEVVKIRDRKARVAGLLGVGACANWNSRLSRWNKGNNNIQDTFYNQALNTLYSHATKSFIKLLNFFLLNVNNIQKIPDLKFLARSSDAREITNTCDIWITDPPYADAVHYHELADFFLAWYEKQLPELFPEWHTNSRQALAVRGSGSDFKHSMVEIYQNLANNMPNDGIQIVMFTHQNAAVWADLGMILARAGLSVTNAWTIATETTSAGIKQGNYVQGTVLLILRKRLARNKAFLDDILPELEKEVLRQLELMNSVDDISEPNFSDTDFQLAAYSAALRVATQYTHIDGKDITEQLYVEKKKNEVSIIEDLIHQALDIAAHHLIPNEIDHIIWTQLTNEEKLYLKGIDLEANGEMRCGSYQELARGFGVKNYTQLYAKTTANQTRFKTPMDFKRSLLSDEGFGESPTRHLLYAIYQTYTKDDPREGLKWLQAERVNYWNEKKIYGTLLKYFMRFRHYEHMPHWQELGPSLERLLNVISNTIGDSRDDSSIFLTKKVS